MIRQVILNISVVWLCFGCAIDPQPKTVFESGTRVGIVNGVGANFTHQHIGILESSSFTKEIEVDWNIPGYLETKLEDALIKDQGFLVATIKSPAIQSRLNGLADDVNSAANRRRVVSPDLANFIENVARSHDLDVVIIVQSFKGDSPWKIYETPTPLQGYGLLTRQRVIGKVRSSWHWIHPYAQILVAVFSAQPVATVGYGRPRLRTQNVENFDWPADIDNIPQAQLDKLRPTIEKYADEAVINALQSTNFVAAERR